MKSASYQNKKLAKLASMFLQITLAWVTLDLLFGSATSHAEILKGAPKADQFKKIMIVVLENTDFTDAIKQPFMSDITKNGATFSDFTAEIHPSQGNYFAMTAGNTFNVTSDRNMDLSTTHIADSLEAAGKSWKVYAEDYPGNCFQGAQSGRYVRKHNPFISFKNIQSNPKRCANIVNASQMAIDAHQGNMPNYSFYAPNMDNDGHDTGVQYADKWLKSTFQPLLRDPKFMKDMLIVFTFDEDSGSKKNLIYTALYGDSVIPGSVATTGHSHYSLLRMMEEVMGLKSLGQFDVTAPVIAGIWK